MTLDESRNKVSSTLNKYTELASGQATIADVLKEKALAAYEGNEDIVEPLDKATAEYYQTPSAAREKYQNIFNPFTREKLVSESVGNASIPMLMYANMYGNRMGRIDDLIGAGTNAYKAQVTAAEGAAKSAQTEYDNLLREYELNQKYAKESEGNDLLAQFNALMGLGAGTSQPTEEMPIYSPGAMGAKSKGGQWEYTENGWKPVQTGSSGADEAKKTLANTWLMSNVINGKMSPTQAKFLGEQLGIYQSSAQQKISSQLASLESSVNQLGALSDLLPKTAGGSAVTSLLSGIPFMDVGGKSTTNAKEFNSLNQAFTGPVARVVLAEVGVLTDKDIQRSGSLLPQITDSAELRSRKIKNINTAINNLKNGKAATSVGNAWIQEQNLGSGSYGSSDWEVVK